MIRRYTFKLYPSPAQDAALREQARMCAQLWNGLLEMRETFYRRALQSGAKKTSLTAFDQGKDLTALRAELPEWRAQPRGTQERVADMLDLAFKAFFRRAKSGAGAQSGYPRYKSTARADSVPLREPAKSCWRMAPREGARKAWTFDLRGIGSMRARGEFPAVPGGFKTADIRFEAGAWTLSVCADLECSRCHGDKDFRVEFGLIDEFARVSRADGPCGAAPGMDSSPSEGEFSRVSGDLPGGPCGEPANAGAAQEILHFSREADPCGEPANAGAAQEHRDRARHTVPCGEPVNAGEAQVDELLMHLAFGGSPQGSRFASQAGEVVDAIKSDRDRRYKRGSKRWRRERLRAAKASARAARQRKDRLHRWSTALVGDAKSIVVVEPPVSQARTGRGTAERPGAEVAAIAALNRRIREQAPAAAIQMLVYKSAEAGVPCLVAPAPDHEIRIGAELRAAAITHRRAKRTVNKEQEKANV